MNLANINGFSLLGLADKNVILGKNGCGKSYLLKRVEQGLNGREGIGKVRYISPERGGILRYEAGVDQNLLQEPQWLENQRRRNQAGNFREQSAALFRRLELLVLREIELKHTQPGYVPLSFDSTVAKMNILLDRVRLERDNTKPLAFKLLDKATGGVVTPEEISSGEAELISLGIEFLVFVKESDAGKENYLLVDEPDVHLHPDLQYRLCTFIIDVLKDSSVRLILATHSTALLAGLAENPKTRVAFMRRGDSSLSFKEVTDVDRSVLPIFGAHPLSNVFNQAPALLVEGEDDERVWQQAVRSSKGRIRVFPCVVGDVTKFREFEMEVDQIISAVYDNARAFSLRDRDLHPEFIDDAGHIVRMRLSCRAAENLMLSNEVLNSVGVDWEDMQQKIRQWVSANTSHQYFEAVQAFVQDGFDRKGGDLKDIRNILVGLVSNKPWEVLVGQSIGRLAVSGGATGVGSFRDFLGEKIYQQLLASPLHGLGGCRPKD